LTAPVTTWPLFQRFATLDIQADQGAVFLVHVRNIGLGEIVHPRVLGFTPVVPANTPETAREQFFLERGEIENVVVNVVEIILPTEQRSDHQIQVAGLPIDLAEHGEVRHGGSQSSAGLKHAIPLSQDTLDIATLEMLEDVAGVDDAHGVLGDEG